ncbi:MAG: EamA family transporter, partial [Arenicellales bacterium]
MSSHPEMGTVEWIFLLILSVLWGGSFFLAKVAVQEMPPLTLVLYRVGLAALTLYLYLRLSGRKVPAGIRIWIAFFIMGLINNAI